MGWKISRRRKNARVFTGHSHSGRRPQRNPFLQPLQLRWLVAKRSWAEKDLSPHVHMQVQHVSNVMAHAQKPDLVFPRNGRVHLNWRGCHFSRLLAAELCASVVVMLVMLDIPCSEVECKTTGYPLHSHVSPSLSLPCVTVCHQVSTEL